MRQRNQMTKMASRFVNTFPSVRALSPGKKGTPRESTGTKMKYTMDDESGDKTHHLLTDSEDNSKEEVFEDWDTTTLVMISPTGVEMELPAGQLPALRNKINNNNQNILIRCNIPDLTDTEDSSDEDSDSEEDSDREVDKDQNDDKKITVVPRLTDSEDNSQEEDFEHCDTATIGMIRPSGVEMELTDGQLSALRDKIINKNNQNILTML